MITSILHPNLPHAPALVTSRKAPGIQVDGQGLIVDLDAQHRGTALIDIYDMNERRWYTEVIQPGDRTRISTAGWPVALYIVAWQNASERGHILCARFPTYCVKVEPDFET